MSAALVGLIGVVVGAALSGAVESALERRKRRVSALAAGWLICEELANAKRRIETSIGKGWWEGRLPTRAWETHAGDLVSFLRLPPKVVGDLARAYAAIDNLNAAREEAIPLNETKPAGSPPADLTRDVQTLQAAQASLKEKVLEPSDVTAVRDLVVRYLAPLVLGGLALVLLGDAVFVARPDVNERTVARALEQKLGERVLVDCDRAGDDFRCGLYRLTAPRSVCLASSNSAAPTAPARSLAATVEPPRSCKVGPRIGGVQVVPEGSKLAVITAGEAERIAINQEVMEKPSESLWDQFKRYVHLR